MIKEKINVTPEEKKMLKSVYLRTLTLSASWNYDRQQALGFLYAMIPVIKSTYDTEEEQKEALKRHDQVFNVTPTMGGLITGLTASMEKEAKKDENFDKESINAVKVSLMGPLSGIGDSIFQGTIRILTLGIGISLAQSGNVLGVLVHLVLYNIIAHLFRYYGTFLGYGMGAGFLAEATEKGYVGIITKAASIVGMLTIGAMATSSVNLTIAATPSIAGSPIEIQAMLDQIFPKALSLLVLFITYKLIKKGVKPIVIMLIYFAIGILGKLVGLF